MEATSTAPELALMMTIGVGTLSMMLRVASNPSICGMCRSIVITFGRNSLASRKHSTPDEARPTTWKAGSVLKM
jgi:hypothetical protein